MRIVLDTNALISALIGHPNGPSARLMDVRRDERFELISSTAQLDELSDVLARPSILKRTTPNTPRRL
ncbi:MAG: PIN domain-containing protein [Planctomycetota bacterium]